MFFIGREVSVFMKLVGEEYYKFSMTPFIEWIVLSSILFILSTVLISAKKNYVSYTHGTVEMSYQLKVGVEIVVEHLEATRCNVQQSWITHTAYKLLHIRRSRPFPVFHLMQIFCSCGKKLLFLFGWVVLCMNRYIKELKRKTTQTMSLSGLKMSWEALII